MVGLFILITAGRFGNTNLNQGVYFEPFAFRYSTDINLFNLKYRNAQLGQKTGRGLTVCGFQHIGVSDRRCLLRAQCCVPSTNHAPLSTPHAVAPFFMRDGDW